MNKKTKVAGLPLSDIVYHVPNEEKSTSVRKKRGESVDLKRKECDCAIMSTSKFIPRNKLFYDARYVRSVGFPSNHIFHSVCNLSAYR